MLTFCITGTLSRPRSDIKAELEARGHKVSASITSKTDYLLVGQDPGAGKLDKAHDLDTMVIAEDMLTEALALADGTAKRVAPPDGREGRRTIYHFWTDEYGENQAMFDESFNLIGAWHSNDADFRPEYMAPWLKALGIVVKPLPESRAQSALEALCDHMGYGDDFGD